MTGEQEESKPGEQSNEPLPQPLLITIPEVAKRLNLGRTKVYELIWREHLPVQKFGRAVRVSLIELKQWLAERQSE